jgi:acyl-coenzyme A synthetase/AMP-(fatty) acid ligase
MPPLHARFEAAAAAKAAKTALVTGERRTDYGTLSSQVAALASDLRGAGVGAGDRVVLFFADALRYAIALHAVWSVGATVVPVAAGARAARIAFVIDDVRARLLLTETGARAVWGDAVGEPARCRLAPSLDAGIVMVSPALTGPEVEPPPHLAAILYTSGTTGIPKGVMLTHSHMGAAWDLVQAYLGLRDDDVIALPLAPTFSYGLYHLLMGLGLGATVVVEPATAFPRMLLQRLAAERATVLPGVPMLFTALLGAGDLGPFDLGSLRLMSNAAAALPVPHLERIAEHWPQAQFFSMYGMTECKRISYLPPSELRRRPASVGRGMAGQEHWLADDGELIVRGPHVMLGYWQRPAETAERLERDAQGRIALRTGDLFRADAEGYLTFVSRKDDIIKTRGEKVAPREVENAICAMPGVAEAAVVGVPDAALGQAVKAYVTLRPGATAATPRAVIRHCLATLEAYMAPKEVEIVSELPHTESGKLRRSALGGTDNG